MSVAKDTYEPNDNYIRKIASDMTPCFGLQFSLQDETCRKCPLAGSCQRKFFGRLAEAAKIVEQEGISVVGGDAGDRADQLAEQISGSAPDRIQEFEAFVDSECKVCGKEIEQGTNAKYNMRVGFWHVECHDDYLKGVRASSS